MNRHFDRWCRATRRLVGVGVALVLCLTLAGGGAAHAAAENPLEPLDTSSPQATYLAFLEQVALLEELLIEYERNRSEATQLAFSAALSDVEALFDLSDVADANLEEVGVTTFASLADILNRLPAPDVDEIPDIDDVEEAEAQRDVTLPSGDESAVLLGGGLTSYTLPGTEITIERVEEGSRSGEYLFSTDTVASLPGWREEVDDLPVNEDVVVGDWVQEEADLTGHLVPRWLVNALPDVFDSTVLGTPLWKVLVDVVIVLVVVVAALLWYRYVGRRGTQGSVSGYVFRLSTPIVLIVLITAARRFMVEQVNHSGDVATIANLLVTAVFWAMSAWAFWLLAKLVVEWVISTPRISDGTVDAHLLRLVGKVVSVAGAFALAWVGLSRLGIPTVGLGVGAGVVGLAVGLAATGTLENLIGGITLYADRPFAVDDNVRIDDDFGKVEEIGPRSTSIRKLDDTRVVLPNSDVSRFKVTNFSERRHIQFLHVVGVRYETTIDQLRMIVQSVDAALRDHPDVVVDADHPRVRVVKFGASSIDIEVRARVDTDGFPEFQRIQEELLLMIFELVESAGSTFAFPSTTAYLVDDAGLPPSTATDAEVP